MCRRRYQTYHSDPLNSQAVFIVAPRGRRGRCAKHQYKAERRQLRHQYKHPELYSVAQHQEALVPVAQVQRPIPQQQAVVLNGTRGYHDRRRGPISGMAALVLGALGLGAHKIHESREKRKAKKAALEWETEQAAAIEAKAGPPPAYEDAVSERGGSRSASLGAELSSARSAESAEMAATVPTELSAQKTGGSGRKSMLDV